VFVVLLVNGMVNDTARFLLYCQGQVVEQHGMLDNEEEYNKMHGWTCLREDC